MLLGIPLLPLLAMLQLGEEGLPVRFVQLNDPFQFFHEEQLQHPLVRVQVRQLEELPLQDVVVSVLMGRDDYRHATASEHAAFYALRTGLAAVQPPVGFPAVYVSMFYVKK